MRKLISLLMVAGLFILFLHGNGNSQENITITTYYPSPSGSYNELQVVTRQAIGNIDGLGGVDAADLALAPAGGLRTAGNIVAGGSVRVGTDTSVCGVANAGALRYNAGVIEFCNGTSWGSISNFGGMFEQITGGGDIYPNPMNGNAYSCPPGFTVGNAHQHTATDIVYYCYK